MIRERMHATVRDLEAWNEYLSLVRDIDEVQAAAGRTTSSGVWTQLVGPYNEIVVELDYPDLATYEADTRATMSDPQVVKLASRFESLTLVDKGYNELFVSADPVVT